MEYRYRFPIFILVFSFIFSNAISQVLETKSLAPERGYEAVEIKFDRNNLNSLTIAGPPTNQLYLYAYYSGQGWQPIPFQIDENDPFVPSNNIIETTDVLIFLAKDLGDKVTLGNWIANPASQSNHRYEIEVVDPLDRSKKGWCYLFISPTLSEQDKSPTKYVQVDAVNDIINSSFYQIDYGGKWYPKNISVTTAGQGNNQDFYDRTKVRFIMLLAGGNWTRLNEDDLATEAGLAIQYTPNPVVRLKRKIPLEVYFFGQPSGRKVKFSMTYYPYSAVFSGDISLQDFMGLARVKYVRMSYDLNSNASGMKFFSGDSLGIKNQNILIDGSGSLDNADTSMAKNKKNWTMVTGTPGSMLTLNEVRYQSNPPAVTPEPSAQYLYYWDNKSGSVLAGREYPAEHDIDTGDSASYGDHGMFYESYALTDSLHYLSTTYFIGANQSGTVAQNMFKNFNEPILSLVYVTEQTYLTGIAGENNDLTPGSYQLKPIFPNPFNPTANITFNLPKNDRVTLQIFDLQGRQIIALVNGNLNAGVHHYDWDGRDGDGKLVSSGIYICVLKATGFHAYQKMAFVK